MNRAPIGRVGERQVADRGPRAVELELALERHEVILFVQDLVPSLRQDVIAVIDMDRPAVGAARVIA